MTKKNILWISVVGSLLFLSLIFLLESHTCSREWMWCREYIWNSSNLILRLLLVTPPLLLFSLLTYRMRDEVFNAWISFAKWFVPVIILITLIIQSGSGGGSGGFSGAVSGWFDAMIIGLLYIIFIIISLWKIIRAYRKTKK